MTQPDRNPDINWQRAINVVLKYKVKLENLLLRKLRKNRPRKLKFQSIASAAVGSDNKPCTVYCDSSDNRRCKPASLTKVLVVMTALDEIDNIKESITVEAGDILPGSGNNLQPGDEITWRDAFHNMLMASSNSSANTVIRALGLHLSIRQTNAGTTDPLRIGIAAMNAKARSLGMTNSLFTNPSGLDSFGMYTTAHDMVKMGAAALGYSELTDAWSKTTHVMNVRGVSPREIVITSTLTQLFKEVPGVCGGKTGTLPDGTQNILICTKRDDSRVITALMQKGGDRHQEILKFLSSNSRKTLVNDTLNW